MYRMTLLHQDLRLHFTSPEPRNRCSSEEVAGLVLVELPEGVLGEVSDRSATVATVASTLRPLAKQPPRRSRRARGATHSSRKRPRTRPRELPRNGTEKPEPLISFCRDWPESRKSIVMPDHELRGKSSKCVGSISKVNKYSVLRRRCR